MFSKSILSIGFAVAAAAVVIPNVARADVGAWFGFGASSGRVYAAPRVVDGATTWDYGVPGRQRPRRMESVAYLPEPGPGRHRVCALQNRYDSRENYVGSRQICWIEAN